DEHQGEVGLRLAVAARGRGLFFFQAEDGIRDLTVTGVQTCALPILADYEEARGENSLRIALTGMGHLAVKPAIKQQPAKPQRIEIGRASCRERVETASEGERPNRARPLRARDPGLAEQRYAPVEASG